MLHELDRNQNVLSTNLTENLRVGYMEKCETYREKK